MSLQKISWVSQQGCIKDESTGNICPGPSIKRSKNCRNIKSINHYCLLKILKFYESFASSSSWRRVKNRLSAARIFPGIRTITVVIFMFNITLVISETIVIISDPSGDFQHKNLSADVAFPQIACQWSESYSFISKTNSSPYSLACVLNNSCRSPSKVLFVV